MWFYGLGVPAFVLIVVINAAVGIVTPGFREEIEWTHQITLLSNLQLKWTNTDPEWITMEMSAPTRGYVGIGFSVKGGMAGSDIALGWIDASGMPYLKDYYGTKNGAPTLDPQQDLELIYGLEDNTGTRIAFKRKWDTCDPHDMIIGDDTVRLIWAWSDDDPVSPAEADLPYHGHGMQRGVRSVFMKAAGKSTKFPDNPKNPRDPTIQHWDITMYNIHVPHSESYYHCQLFEFPHLAKKNHIIGYRPITSKESIPHIHHMNVYNCHVPETVGKTKDFLGKYVTYEGGDCFGASTPWEWKEYCYALRIASSVVAEGEMYPSHLGDEVGNAEGEPTLLLLEVHYENPYGVQLLDNSGIRIFYTEQLRPYDLSMLFVGHRRTPFLTIPPHQKNFQITGHCSGECTQMGFPQTGVKITSVLLHSHLTGRHLILRHIRNGRELEPIAEDSHYDFNYQEYRNLAKEVTVLPGDELIMECNHETLGNNSFIYGGLSSIREMCEAFIFYYPKASLVDCRSQPEYYAYLEAIGVKNATGSILRKLKLPYDPSKLSDRERLIALPDDAFVLEFGASKSASSNFFNGLTIRSPEKLVNQNMQDYMVHLNWKDEAFSRKVETAWRQAPRYMHCAAHGGVRIQNPHPILKIADFVPKVRKRRECEVDHTSGSPSGSTKMSWSKCIMSTAALVAVNTYLLYLQC